jgi:hypothetical protein
MLHWEDAAMDYVIRFFVGGLIVSVFAIVGDILRPKSFAGLFGAAPSVALATLTLAIFKEGNAYIAIEGRSMILGALALSIYCVLVCQLLMRLRWPAVLATGSALAVWLIVALGLEHLLIG